MEFFLKPMMWVNVGFAFVVALLSALTLFSVEIQPATIIFTVIGAVCFVIIFYGFKKMAPMTVATGSFACALLLPTQMGILPMIIAFAFFILLLSLQLYLVFIADQTDM